ncbi:hypothetical protein, partial [Pseudomonas syringae group genomosp. 7]|uniref:hypothetical protein n=1 Tax=Pseudomonas syringae group genomosp. 7 TaxID=251699 RepID=UPI00376F5DFC
SGSAPSLANCGGTFSTGFVAPIMINALVDIQSGHILGDAQLTLDSASLDISQIGRIGSIGLVLTTGAFDIHKDGRLTSTG